MKVSEFIEWLKTQDQDAEVLLTHVFTRFGEELTEHRIFRPDKHAHYSEASKYSSPQLTLDGSE